MWLIEEIPNEDALYYRIHQSYLVRGELKPGAFREIEDGMSTDWSKYSTPLESRSRAKKPEQNGIVRLNVGSLRQLKLTIVHAPSKDNRAHSLVKGVDDVEIRLKLLDKLLDTTDDHIQWEILAPTVTKL